MFLKRIELQGFKSFANKTVLQFDQDITGIVGPNGCGKSNINDAIRWVLGEQSVKSLRSGGNMSDIIFSGSEQKKKVNMAKVSLVFDNSRRIFDTPFDEVEIARQIQRSNNEATYTINRTPCRLKDIQELIMDTGLGRDSLSIISQGNISAFADAKPEERRSLFEEAAGVAKYKKRKQASLSKLEKTKENLDRLQDIIDELDRQLKPLEKQAEKARQYIAYREELSDIEISVLVEEIESYAQTIAALQKSMDDQNLNYTNDTELLEEKEERLNHLKKSAYQLDSRIQSLQQEYTKVMEESVDLEKQKIELDEKRKYTLQTADLAEQKKTLYTLKEEARFEYEDRKKRFEELDEQAKEKNDFFRQISNRLDQIVQEERQASSLFQKTLNRKHILRSMMESPYQHQGGVKVIMEAKNSLYGIEGTIAQLLKAKPEFGQAISNALGGVMYQIVTKDERSARNAIDFLKRNRSGRATFLPLSVCSPRYPNERQKAIVEQSEGVLGWACDFVENDSRYNSLKSRLLGNIVVTDTLEHANEVAKRIHYSLKIVTKDGDIVHTGGAMRGGRSRSNTNPITMQEEMKEIETRLSHQKSNLEELHEKQREYEQKKKSIEDQKVSLQIERAKIENIVQVKKEKYDSICADYNVISVDSSAESIELDDSLIQAIAKNHAKKDELSRNLTVERQNRFGVGEAMEKLEEEIRSLRRSVNVWVQTLHKQEMELATTKTKQSSALERLNTNYQMTYEFACSKRKEVDLPKAKELVRELRAKIKRLGNVNLDAPQEFEEIKERYTFLTSQKEDLLDASKQILEAIDQMDKTMVENFTTMFNKINQELDGVFKAMFGGGKARLSLVDPEDVLNTGIDIDVQPPGKTIKNIQSFSGGEKALIAISVLFSILQARLIPLCIFDEVEAALDQSNVERFAKYLAHFRNQSQFIVVTHRPGTMEQCDTLYGVTMQQDGVSQILKVMLKDAVQYIDKEGR